ncbi:MAG TPA: hypothetical protein VFD27_04715, partial [Chthoniobacteraceae bacterium]|nr:hypothetical protein [Chthoniobacteraceae bacterium]
MARKLVLLSCACAVRLADAATFTVLNTDDSGVGSLREAITLANADNTTPRMINFSAAGTITLTSALPQVTKFMTIDATTAPGYAGTPVVTIDGNSGDFDGLTVNAFFTGNANNKTFVKGLCIINCGMNGGTARNGITLVDGDSVTVSGCFIGINAAGTAAARNTAAGIRCELAVATIGGTGTNDRCVISGNLGAGIDGQTDGSNQGSPITVLNSYIGLGANGMTAVPNGGDGIRAVPSVSAAALTVGSTVAGSGNFISANGGAGIRTQRSATIKRNTIGLGVDGTTARGNTQDGIVIAASASVIGFGAGDGNVVSANGGDGVRVSSPSTSRSTIRDNFIGTDSTGMLDRGNGMYGVEILGGGATGGAALGLNVISGNTLFGVRVASGDGNISTSKIGLNTAATAAIPNQGGGVWVDNAVTLTITSCTISGNAGPGVKVSGASADAITLTGNAIGLNGPGGGVDLGNTGHGIEISGGAEHAVIGSANLDSNINEIRFNGGNGINADSCNRILFNKIFGNESDAFGGGG